MPTAPGTVRVLQATNGRSLADLLPGCSHPAADRLTVTTATGDGRRQQVADHIADGAVDCVVVDHEPPDDGVIELLDAVRADHPDLPVVLRTDNGSEELASDAIAAGVSAYLHTNEVDQLVDRVVDLAESYRGDRERDRQRERTADLLAQAERIADIGGWEIDTDTTELFWTDHLFDLLGVEGDTEPTLAGALDLCHEADRPVLEAAIDAALDVGTPVDEEVRIRRPDDERRWVRIRGIPVVDGDHVETFRGTVQDVTERRSRERVLREMHDIIADREAAFDQQVRDLLELGRTELGTRYGTLSKISGDDYTFEFVASDDDKVQAGNVVPVSATNCEVAASTEQTLVLGDIERDAPEETHRAGFAEWGIACYLGAPVFVDEAVYGTFCFYDTEPLAGQFSEWERTLVDLMSRWVSYELQRQQVTERLADQNEQLERFASIVSHDLRNPLSIIEGYVQQTVETGEIDHLSRVQSAIDRMDTLIDDMLLLSRSKDAIGDASTVDLADLVEDCWKTVPTETATLTAATDRSIRADETRLQQLLENLFRNSVEHGSTSSRAEPGDSVEHGSTGSRPEADDAIEHGGEGLTVTVGDLDGGFYFEDDGPGIPEDDRERIFNDGYSTSQDGTGLGLSIVAEIVDAHGWTVDVTEGTDGGARFEITGVDVVE